MFTNVSSLFLGMNQTNQVYSNNDKGRAYQTCNFYDPMDRDFCVGACQYKSFSENALYLLKIFLSTRNGSDLLIRECFMPYWQYFSQRGGGGGGQG